MYKNEHPDEKILESLIKRFSNGYLDIVLLEAKNLILEFPRSFKLWNILGAVHTQNDNVDDAEKCYQTATKINPDYAQAHNNLGNLLKQQIKYEEAINSYETALMLEPKLHEAIYNLGVIFQEREEYELAERKYLEVLSKVGDHEYALINLGDIFRQLGRFDDSAKILDKAETLYPNSAQTKNNIGLILRDEGKLEESIEYYRKAISLKSDYAEAYNNLGITFRDQGRFDDAIKSYEKAINIDPKLAQAHLNLSKLKTYRSDDPQIEQMNQIYLEKNLNPRDKHRLAFALGKVYEDLEDNEKSIHFIMCGNSIQNRLQKYNISADRTLFSKIKATFLEVKSSLLEVSKEERTPIPIFILGMPRSGTTLVEQIISCHSMVEGAGELALCSQYALPLIRNDVEVNKNSLHEFRRNYLKGISKISCGKPYVTDKMPSNFRYIGLIQTALPEAKIIHISRDAAAVCWSNFKTSFASKNLCFTNNLEDLVSYYKLYLELMDFWRTNCLKTIHELNYEKLTDNKEEEIRYLIQNLGLSWQEACLTPEKNKRSVKTASNKQVREKVYKGSSNEWKKFEPYLNGVFDAL